MWFDMKTEWFDMGWKRFKIMARWGSFYDDCGPHFSLRSGAQGWSHNKSWDARTSASDTGNWGYVDHPYYRRSYSIPYWATRQVYAEASLRWIERPYLVCL
ncbi:hypothetical protein DV701_13795 [Ornithinimicrobium avium]|uniref:Uncharacterized protein n=1 Tax=Ornithinimicrobium avium TaxID=2283195 RepID=A0A345NPU2_9MICO|nr:hypothetical protein DV701_13795 [Ornithinimicrobium avium]